MPLTDAEKDARIATLEADGAATAAQRDALQTQVSSLQAEVARLTALVPADTDNTAAITVSEYRWNLAGVYQGLATMVAAGAVPTQTQLNLKEKWKWIFQFLESLDQQRRVNTKVAPVLTITNAAFADGFITAAKRDYLNTLA